MLGRLYAEPGGPTDGRPAWTDVRFKVLLTADVDGGSALPPGVGSPDRPSTPREADVPDPGPVKHLIDRISDCILCHQLIEY